MSNPKASYIIGNFNKQAYIAEAISSLLASTEKNIEICIVDDASTDYSMDILNYYAKKDSRIKLEQNEVNSGVAVTYNRATKMCTAPIILVAASDDVYSPDRAKWAIRAFKKFPADIIYWPFNKAQERSIGDHGVVLATFEKKSAPAFDAEWLKKVDGQFIGHGFSAYKREVGIAVPYREEMKHGVDHHFFLDCWKAGYKFQNIEDEEQVAGIYRFYIDMVSSKFRDEIVKQDVLLEKEYLNAN